MRAKFFWLLATVITGAACALPCEAQQGVQWQPTLESAKRLASQSNRLVLIHFWAPWCHACRRMEQDVFSRSDVAAALEPNYVAVRLNADHFPATARQFGVTSLPTDVMVTSDGQLIDRVNGAVQANAYINKLSQVASSNLAPPQQQYAQDRPMPSHEQLGPSGYAGPAGAGPAPHGGSVSGRMAPNGAQSGNYEADLPGPTRQPAYSPAPNQQRTTPSAYGASGPGPVSEPSYAPSGPRYADDSTHTPGGSADYSNSAPSNYPPQMAGPSGPNGAPPNGTGFGRSGGEPAAAHWGSPHGEQPTTHSDGSGYGEQRYGASTPAGRPAENGYGGQPTTPPTSPYGNQPAEYASEYGTHGPEYGGPSNAADQFAPGSSAGPPAANSPPLGLDGYCPVRLAESQQWVLGDRRWGAIHEGCTYLFAGPAEQQRFLANPDRYGPVMSGDDVVLAIDDGRSVPGCREHGVFYGGRVYLFSSEESLEKFSRVPNRYASAVQQSKRIPTNRVYR